MENFEDDYDYTDDDVEFDVDELQELEDFAHDGDFDNMYATEDGFYSNEDPYYD